MILLLFRIGAAIPVPFLKPDILKTYISGDNNWLGYIDLLSGGAFSNSTLFALGISPYITASIVIQLLAVAIPALEQLAKEGEEGRKILNKYTRYCTVALGLLQSVAYYFLMPITALSPIPRAPQCTSPLLSSSLPSWLAPCWLCGWVSRSTTRASAMVSP